MTAVVIPLRQQLQASLDLTNLGGTIRDAGAVMMGAGTHVMMLNEMPTELMLDEIAAAGRAMIGMVVALRIAAVAKGIA